MKLLEVYFENPGKSFTIRELSSLASMPKSTVQRILSNLKKEGLINGDNTPNENIRFKTKKMNFFIERIVDSGLIEDIISNLNPSCIILFGSIRKGDSDKESDIDIFIESPLNTFDFSKYERKLKHPIQAIIEPSLNKLQPHLFNNVVNGIKLYGAFKVK